MMTKLIQTICLSAILFSGMLNATAGETNLPSPPTKEFVSWSKFKISLQEEFRFKDEGSSFFYQFTDLQLKYSVSKYFDVFGDYRLIFKQKEGEWDQSNVLMPGFTIKYPTEKFGKFEIRTRAEAGVDLSPVTWALNVQPKYNTPWKWTRFDLNPYVANEMFFDIRNDMEYTVNRIRAGVDMKLSKKVSASVGYYYETAFDKKTDANVVSAAVKFEF
jgi:hypothetical protein